MQAALQTESDLIAAARRGCGGAFGELAKLCAHEIFRRALAITACPADAEDILQETLLKAFVHLRQFREDARFSTWAVRIGINEALMARRRKSLRFPGPADCAAFGASEKRIPEIPDTALSPEGMLVWAERGDLIRHALGALPLRHRQVFVLRYVEGFSTQEAAEALSLRCATVKAYACRSRAFLKERLAPLLNPRGTSSGRRRGVFFRPFERARRATCLAPKFSFRAEV